MKLNNQVKDVDSSVPIWAKNTNANQDIYNGVH